MRPVRILALIASAWLPAFSQGRASLEFLGNQVERPGTPATTSAGPVTLTLKDALELAQKNDPQFLAALSDATVAAEDLRQARLSRYPSFSDRTEYLGTQGNGKTPNGRYVTNDGVHVYREWAVLHQDLTAGTFNGIGIDRAGAAEALARQALAEFQRTGAANNEVWAQAVLGAALLGQGVASVSGLPAARSAGAATTTPTMSWRPCTSPSTWASALIGLSAEPPYSPECRSRLAALSVICT